jgi:hypothetical protein
VTVNLLLFGSARRRWRGSTLIGLAIDYPYPLLTHRMLAPTGRRHRARTGSASCSAIPAAGSSPAWTSLPACARWPVPRRRASWRRWRSRYVLRRCSKRPPRAGRCVARGAGGARARMGARRAGRRPRFWARAGPGVRARALRLRWLDSLAALSAIRARRGADACGRASRGPRRAGWWWCGRRGERCGSARWPRLAASSTPAR